MILFNILTVSSFISLMIKINSNKDERISQCFPNDPYSNLCIVTTTQKLFLQHAFLSMDSAYFSRIDPDARQVDLRELPQQPLFRVLHALYGEELMAASVRELAQLLPIILYLEIQQYRKNIEKDVLAHKDFIQNVEMIELSWRNQFLWEEVVQAQIDINLSHLENSKSYLQIGKLSDDTFNQLLTGYIQKVGLKHEKVLNSVMENYFNRKGIKPIPYLQSHNLQPLLVIWMNFHHTYQGLFISNNCVSPTKITKNLKQSTLIQKKGKVKQLELQIQSKDDTISSLLKTIQQVKLQLGVSEKSKTAQSLFIETNQSQAPLSKQKHQIQKRNKKSPQFKSCIYEGEIQKQKRSLSPNWKIYNRFGSKNSKKWK